MADISQEQALAVLKEAKEKGALNPSVEAELARLAGVETRPKVEETLEAPVSAEEVKRELTPEQTDKLLGALRSRFGDADEKLRKAIDFADVEKSLRAAPEKLYALQKLEETDGEPELIGIDGDEFIFEDRSAESPSGRRDLDADQAAAQAEAFGADMQSPDAYRAMQKAGKFDLNSGSWLKTDAETREAGYAMYGRRDVVGVYISGYSAEDRVPRGGWRASLRVRKA